MIFKIYLYNADLINGSSRTVASFLLLKKCLNLERYTRIIYTSIQNDPAFITEIIKLKFN